MREHFRRQVGPTFYYGITFIDETHLVKIIDAEIDSLPVMELDHMTGAIPFFIDKQWYIDRFYGKQT